MSTTPEIQLPQKNTTSPVDENTTRGRELLFHALMEGAQELPKQIRYILMLAQLNHKTPSLTSYPEKPLNLHQARLMTLADLPVTYSASQLNGLIRDILQIGDASVRLPLLLKYATRLDSPFQAALVRDVWKQNEAVVDPVVRTRIYLGMVPLLGSLRVEAISQMPMLQQVVREAQEMRSMEARVRSLTALAVHLPIETALTIFARILSELAQSSNDSLSSKSIIALAPYLPKAVQDQAIDTALKIQNKVECARALTVLSRHLNADDYPLLDEQALNAIDSIENEDERAEALIAFAPNLEYATEQEGFPKLLEKALVTTVMIGRRHIRAKVLVALAPHLTIDLQGEALAAVHTLSNERDRAMMLAQLAPTLPSDMLVASLAVAHTMREQDSRVQALAALARYVPESARQQTTLDAVATASNLPNQYERVQALVSLLDIVPDNIRDTVLQNAIIATKDITNEYTRARALSLLGAYLSPQLQDQALEIARAIQNVEKRLHALLGLVGYLPTHLKSQVLDEMLAGMNEQALEYKKARGYINIIPYLSEEQLLDIEPIADKMGDIIDQVNMYITMAQYLPPNRRKSITDKTLAKLRRIEEGYDRATALMALAPLLREEDTEKLSRLAQTTIESVSDEYDRASVIAQLAPLLKHEVEHHQVATIDIYTVLRKAFDSALNVPQQAIRIGLLKDTVDLWVAHFDEEMSYTLWKDLVPRFISLPLSDVLLCLTVMIPFFTKMTGETIAQHIAYLLGIR